MLFYHTQTIVARSNDAWSMQKLSKNPEIMWRKCQHLSVTSHGSDSVFIEWLAFIYLWITIFHCPTESKTWKSTSPRGVLWKTFFKNWWKFTGKHLSRSMFFNKTAVWGPANLWKRESGSDVFMWIFTIFTSWTACWNNICQSMHMNFSEYMCHRNTDNVCEDFNWHDI